MKIGIKDISERTGYSIATVSNALNNKRGVNSKTSSKIFRVAQQMGYVNGSKITRIRFVTYKRSGLVIDDSPFFPDLMRGVELESRENGYETVFSVLNKSNQDFKAQIHSIFNDVSSGLILLGTEMLEEDYHYYRSYSNPVVILDGWSNTLQMDCVQINNIDAAFQAAAYLIQKGHRRIGYLKSKFRIKNFSQRSLGFQQALRKAELPLPAHHIVPLTSTMEGACRDMRGWLSGNDTLPTAFFADNDVIALGAMRALKEIGYHIPRDISIIGFDNLSLAEIASPGLTTIHVFNEEMGRIAVRRLVENIKSSCVRARTKNQVYTEFVERGSVLDINTV